MVRSFEQMRTIVDRAPKGFGDRPSVYRYDVVFFQAPADSGRGAEKRDRQTRGRSRLRRPRGAVFLRLISKAAQSHLSRVVGKPAYQSMTIRNWNTTCKLLQLMEGKAKAPSRDEAGK